MFMASLWVRIVMYSCINIIRGVLLVKGKLKIGMTACFQTVHVMGACKKWNGLLTAFFSLWHFILFIISCVSDQFVTYFGGNIPCAKVLCSCEHYKLKMDAIGLGCLGEMQWYFGVGTYSFVFLVMHRVCMGVDQQTIYRSFHRHQISSLIDRYIKTINHQASRIENLTWWKHYYLKVCGNTMWTTLLSSVGC